LVLRQGVRVLEKASPRASQLSEEKGNFRRMAERREDLLSEQEKEEKDP